LCTLVLKVLKELATARLGPDASEGGSDSGGGDSRAGRMKKRRLAAETE
jgi:hypothetical protein